MNRTRTFVRALRVVVLLQTRNISSGILFCAATAFGSGVVSQPTEASLRAALAGGGLVTFACDGTIALARTITNATDTVLDGSGHRIILSGANASRVVYVLTNISFTVLNLTLASGRSELGGALLNDGVTRATNCDFRANLATNLLNRFSAGGAVCNRGTFIASRCDFRENQAVGFTLGAPEESFAQGAAVANFGALLIESCSFLGNQAIGRDGNRGYDVFGGGSGGAGWMGATAQGGALFNSGSAAVINSTIVSNRCRGGYGGMGGEGPYYMHGRERYYYGPGGNGGDGGSGLGGGIYSVAYPISLTNCTIAYNNATGGTGGYPGGGSPPGTMGANGVAGVALQADVTARLVNCLLATNSPGNGDSSLGDLGHNLSSDGTCAFAGAGSLNDTDARLGPLANNDEPVPALSLLPGSPAIDAGDDASAPAVDQRGRPRPYGRSSDVGAYEVMPLLQFQQGATGGWDILLRDGQANQTCWLMASPTLSNWQCVATNQTGPEGSALFRDNQAIESQRFYRVAKP